jgi:hypothetical protein
MRYSKKCPKISKRPRVAYYDVILLLFFLKRQVLLSLAIFEAQEKLLLQEYLVGVALLFGYVFSLSTPALLHLYYTDHVHW